MNGSNVLRFEKPAACCAWPQMIVPLCAPAINWNSRGTIIYANRAFNAATGYSAADLKDMHFAQLLCDEDPMLPPADVREAFLLGERGASFIAALRCREGNIIYLSWTSAASPGGDRVVGFALDMTAFVLAQANVNRMADVLRSGRTAGIESS